MRYYCKEVSDLALLVAMTSCGEIMFQFMTGNNNDASVQAFLIKLAQHLDHHKPDWRSNHVLLLDNCPSHKTKATLEVLDRLQIPTVFSAPASYIVIPVEQLFASIKALDLNMREEPDPSEFGDGNIRKFTVK